MSADHPGERSRRAHNSTMFWQEGPSAGAPLVRTARLGVVALVLAVAASPALSLGPARAESLSRVRQSAETVWAAQLALYPNIETVGVVVSGASLPMTARLMYRESGGGSWLAGHPLVRISDGRLVGSLFGLAAGTSYDVQVYDGSSELLGSVSTQRRDLLFTPSAVLHVDAAAAPGGDGSAEAPFRTIQDALKRAAPGTQVLVADGIYHETVTFPASGKPGQWIQIKAQGSGAILDGGREVPGNAWKKDGTAAHVWFTKWTEPITYLQRDGKRWYQYDDLAGLRQGLGHERAWISDGWYFDAGTARLYVRSLGDPSDHTWRTPDLNHAIDVAGRDWVWIEGLEIRLYGADTNGCGICVVNASHVVIRENNIHSIQLGISVNWTGVAGEGDDTRIEGNEVYDPSSAAWPWKAVKATSMEGTGIVVRGHMGAIVRDNYIHDLFNGIYTGSSGALHNRELAFDADIYNNRIRNIGDDALEPEGACINQRFRNNVVENSFVGVSLAPITVGPVWVMRSTFADFSGRGVKWDANSAGIVMIYDNTFWSTVEGVNGMDLISPIHNVRMRNNIFETDGFGVAEVPRGSTGIDWDYDNWFTLSEGPHFKWEDTAVNDLRQLCAVAALECHGFEDAPGLAAPASGQFTLLPGSPNIDGGAFVPGISGRFAGKAPDVGAYELGCGSPPTVLSTEPLKSDPASGGVVRFVVQFSADVTGVDISDFALRGAGSTAATIMDISGAGATYSVGVLPPMGGDPIHLDVLDDDSIRDACLQPLGGKGLQNGSFTIGASYPAIP